MALFKKQKRVIEVGGQKIELEPKPAKSPFSFFGKKNKKETPVTGPQSVPIKEQKAQQVVEPVNKIEADQGVAQKDQSAQVQQKQKPKIPDMQSFFQRPKREKSPVEQLNLNLNIKPLKKQKLEFPEAMSSPGAIAAAEELGTPTTAMAAKHGGKPSVISNYLQKTLSKQKGLANALREQNIKTEPYEFVRRMFIASVILSIVLVITIFILFNTLNLAPAESVVLALVMGIAIFQTAFRTFLQYPLAKAKSTSKNVERDILFAARDLIISLR